MPPKKEFFYIITRDGQIFELIKTDAKLASAFGAMKDRAIASFSEEGVVVNGVDISKILNAEQYESYISSVRPTQYIRNGTWFDIKNHEFVRREKWRQEEMDAKALPSKDTPSRPANAEYVAKIRKELMEMKVLPDNFVPSHLSEGMKKRDRDIDY